MSVRTIEGKIGAVYKTEDFFAAIAVLGDEFDYVKFVGLYNEDDLVELQLDPDVMAVSQVTLTNCRHFDDRVEAMPVPDAEEGIVVVDMPKHVDCFLGLLSPESRWPKAVGCRRARMLPMRK